MESFSPELFATTLALIGVVVLVAALLSGAIERTGLPQVAVFLALGAALGPAGLGMIDLTLDSPTLRIVATLSLALVLFTDAVSLSVAETRRHAGLAGLVLGPGTLVTAALTALAGWWLLGLPWPAAIVLGAALASTDPVILRGLLRRRDIPAPTRLALRLEGGLNDVVLLPIVLVAMAFMGGDVVRTPLEWAQLGVDLFLLGPLAGVLVGLFSVGTLDLVRRRVGIRRDYESLYALGVAFTAFAAAESVHGSGFLAAFAAGLTITALDVELCDCFLEYGETTAEMALLLTFVLLGSSLIWSGFGVLSLAALAFALFVLLVRVPVFLAALAPAKLERRSSLLIAWFGPRGLSSLLLVLLPVFAELPGAQALFATCCLVVLISVLLHGFSPLLLRRRTTNDERPPTTDDAERTTADRGLFPQDGVGSDRQDTSEAIQLFATTPPAVEESTRSTRITVAEVERLAAAGAPVAVVDVRTERSYGTSDVIAAGALRMPPDNVVERARELRLDPAAWIVLYCT
ncbi:MAG TPA: cation:proton antiporter [Roseiflexaceae bacterium]|nr:cation:proton antiporter [Roseiflexaceae bacterium]